MSKIAVLGLGAMGSRMAMNLLKAGFEVTVWNRSPDAAVALVEAGAHQAATPRAAVEEADFVMTMLRDDDASRQVWLDQASGALFGMRPGTVAIESSTVTPGWIQELGFAAEALKIELLEAPVSGSLPQAAAAQLIYLVGGHSDTLARAQHVLNAMGSSVQAVGPLGHGALVKLATNTMLGIQVTVIAELIGMLKRSGADAAQALAAVAATPVWSPVAQRLAGSMLAGDFTSQFPIELIEKDFAYTVNVAGSEAQSPVIAAARDVFRSAIDKGWGDDNMTAVARLYSEH